MLTEAERNREADLRANPLLREYIGTMLQDLQFSEADEASSETREARDSGTIYDCPNETFAKCRDDAWKFYEENRADIEAALELIPGEEGLQYANNRPMTLDRIAYYLWMTRVGHGVAITDDGNAPCLQRLDKAAASFGNLDAYFGDDGRAYLS